jgi:hypothetical protein
MLTGVLPFDDHDDAVLLRKIRKGGAPGVRVHRPDLPVALEAVIARAIARSRELRYQSAAELVRDLTPFASPRPSAPAKAPQAAAREASSLTPLESEVTLRVARAGSVQLYAALCVVGLALAVALAWVPWRSPHPQAGASAAPAAGARPAEPALGIGRMAPLPEARRVPAPAKLAAVALDPVLPSEAQPDARARPASEDRAADARRSRRAARRAAKRHALAEPAPPAQSSSLPAIGSELLDPFD